MKPLLLDLFCGAGGAASGYHRAGFDVVGIDLKTQLNYPFEFHQGDAIDIGRQLLEARTFDAVHASPPCQAHSTVSGNAHKAGVEHIDMIPETRELLRASGLPYVIENVVGAPLLNPTRYCGSSFGLDLRRHRLFESNCLLMAPDCDHGWQTPRFRSLDSANAKAGRLASVIGVHGNCNYAGEGELRKKAMGIDWMTQPELAQAIPPAYTEHVGRQLLAHIGAPC